MVGVLAHDHLRHVAGVAPGDRPVAVTAEVRRRLAMTAETEVMKARFCADTKIGATAAMTTDTRARPAPIGEVVMTLNAVHLAVFVVGKLQGQPLTTPHARLAKRERRASAQQCKQQRERAENDRQHEPRVTSKDQPTSRTRGVRRVWRRGSPRAGTQQRKQHYDREQYVGGCVRPPPHVTTGSDHMHGQSDDQQAGRADMRGLKYPVARPQPRAQRAAGRHGKKQQRKERDYPGVFVQGSGRLDVLHHGGIGAEQQADVEDSGAKHHPAEKLMRAKRESGCGAAARSHREHAENETTGNRAKTQRLRDLPRCTDRRHGGVRVYTAGA